MGRLDGVQMRAARVDANQVAIVKALRSYGCSVTHLHQVGNGCPDLLLGIHGRTGLVEVKTAKGKKTDDQIRWWDEWKGGPVAIVTDVDGALRFARLLAFEPEKACETTSTAITT
jgi:hypothetical protein